MSRTTARAPTLGWFCPSTRASRLGPQGHTHTDIHARTLTLTVTHTHAHIYTCTQFIHFHSHTFTHSHTLTQTSTYNHITQLHAHIHTTVTDTFTRSYACIHTHAHNDSHTSIHLHTHTQGQWRTHTLAYMLTHILTHSQMFTHTLTYASVCRGSRFELQGSTPTPILLNCPRMLVSALLQSHEQSLAPCAIHTPALCSHPQPLHNILSHPVALFKGKETSQSGCHRLPCFCGQHIPAEGSPSCQLPSGQSSSPGQRMFSPDSTGPRRAS